MCERGLLLYMGQCEAFIVCKQLVSTTFFMLGLCWVPSFSRVWVERMGPFYFISAVELVGAIISFESIESN